MVTYVIISRIYSLRYSWLQLLYDEGARIRKPQKIDIIKSTHKYHEYIFERCAKLIINAAAVGFYCQI